MAENQSQAFQYGSALMKHPDAYARINNASKLMKTLREELDHTLKLGLEGVTVDKNWRERKLLFRWPLEGIQGNVTDGKWRHMVRAAVLGGLEDVGRAQQNGRWRVCRYNVEIEDRPADLLSIPESGIENATWVRGTQEEIIVHATAVDVSGADDLEYVDGAPAKQGAGSRRSAGAEDIATALRDAIVSITNPEAVASSSGADQPTPTTASSIATLAEEHGLSPEQLVGLLDSLKQKNRNDKKADAAATAAEVKRKAPGAYQCGLCARDFKNPQAIRFHMKKHVSTGELTEEDAASLSERWIQDVKKSREDAK